MVSLRWTSVSMFVLVLVVGCGRSILILPGVGEADTAGSDTDEDTGPLTIGEETGSSSAACGDGVVEGDELCDGSDLGGWTCVDFGFVDGELSCAPGCTIDATGCSDGDLDTGDGDSGPSDTGPGDGDGDGDACGNGMIDEGEECDGADFGGINCIDLGFGPGLPLCIGCKFDTSTCPPDPIEGDPCDWNAPCPDGFACVDGTCYDGSPGDPCESDDECQSVDCMQMGMWGNGTCN
jgi:hypothetical protein